MLLLSATMELNLSDGGVLQTRLYNRVRQPAMKGLHPSVRAYK